MRGWRSMLGGLLVWTVHFALLYIVTSVFLTSPTSRILSGVATVICLVAAALVVWHGCAKRGGQDDDPDARWSRRLAALTGGSAAIAIVWQGLPAMLI